MKIESKDELKEIGIKNRRCYHLDDIITVYLIIYNNIIRDDVII